MLKKMMLLKKTKEKLKHVQHSIRIDPLKDVLGNKEMRVNLVYSSTFVVGAKLTEMLRKSIKLFSVNTRQNSNQSKCLQRLLSHVI